MQKIFIAFWIVLWVLITLFEIAMGVSTDKVIVISLVGVLVGMGISLILPKD